MGNKYVPTMVPKFSKYIILLNIQFLLFCKYLKFRANKVCWFASASFSTAMTQAILSPPKFDSRSTNKSSISWHFNNILCLSRILTKFWKQTLQGFNLTWLPKGHQSWLSSSSIQTSSSFLLIRILCCCWHGFLFDVVFFGFFLMSSFNFLFDVFFSASFWCRASSCKKYWPPGPPPLIDLLSSSFFTNFSLITSKAFSPLFFFSGKCQILFSFQYSFQFAPGYCWLTGQLQSQVGLYFKASLLFFFFSCFFLFSRHHLILCFHLFSKWKFYFFSCSDLVWFHLG